MSSQILMASSKATGHQNLTGFVLQNNSCSDHSDFARFVLQCKTCFDHQKVTGRCCSQFHSNLNGQDTIKNIFEIAAQIQQNQNDLHTNYFAAQSLQNLIDLGTEPGRKLFACTDPVQF